MKEAEARIGRHVTLKMQLFFRRGDTRSIFDKAGISTGISLWPLHDNEIGYLTGAIDLIKYYGFVIVNQLKPHKKAVRK